MVIQNVRRELIWRKFTLIFLAAADGLATEVEFKAAIFVDFLLVITLSEKPTNRIKF